MMNITIVGRCKNCKHYKLGERWSFVCNDKDHICELTQYGGEKQNKESLAHAIDAGNCFAVLVVQPEFGCVQFQQKG